MGHLALLWLWRIEDGELTGFTVEEIAAAARWTGNTRQFLEVLVLGGFVDQVNGRDVLHDHEEHQGSVKEARRKARQRARKRGAPANGDDRPVLSWDAVLSRDGSRGSAWSPATDQLSAEIDQRFDAIVAAPARH